MSVWPRLTSIQSNSSRHITVQLCSTANAFACKQLNMDWGAIWHHKKENLAALFVAKHFHVFGNISLQIKLKMKANGSLKRSIFHPAWFLYVGNGGESFHESAASALIQAVTRELQEVKFRLTQEQQGVVNLQNKLEELEVSMCLGNQIRSCSQRGSVKPVGVVPTYLKWF